ncbi:hypothetical protein ACEPAG_6751 [Sanghuangporus baumii]
MRPHRHLSVRPASIADSAEIARVCLLTAYQGRSAETLVRHPELPAQVQALQYLHLPSGFAFVLVKTTEHPESDSELESRSGSGSGSEEETRGELRLEKERTESGNIVGYVVGTAEKAQFEREINASWWPTLRTKYSKDLVGTPLDRYFVGLVHKGPILRPAGSGTAHIHVNVIGKYKKHGYDRILVDVALHHLRKREKECNDRTCLSTTQIIPSRF